MATSSKSSSPSARRKIHLHRQPRNTKSRGLVEYYSLATCFYENGKNQKKILQGIGELTKQQAEQYRFLLKALNDQSDLGSLTSIEELIYQDEKSYLDVLVFSTLWDQLGFKKLFSSSTKRPNSLSTEQIAQILTLNKLLFPTSKIKTIPWLKSTMLSHILGFDERMYERNKIFRELSNIHSQKSDIEKFFLQFSQQNRSSYEVYYFDGTTSWFEGGKCSLSTYDKEKTRGYYDGVIGFMLVTDNHGYPVAWQVVNGKTKDTTAFASFIERISNEHGFSELTYCFDRGVASAHNFDLVKKHNGKFISGIKDNQIKKVFDLEKFRYTRVKITDRIEGNEETTDAKKVRRIIDIDGFIALGSKVYFKDLGIKGGQRYIASFKYPLFIKEHQDRNKRIDQGLKAIADKNKDLLHAKKDRDFNATERDLLEILKKFRISEFFTYTLKPDISENQVNTFKIELKQEETKIEKAKLSDGVLIYVTDHIEKNKTGNFKLAASEIIEHYKKKYVVENAFREMKSFLNLRPIHVWTDEHVKAHFDIAIIACFINNYIYQKLSDTDVSLRDFYTELKAHSNAVKLQAPRGVESIKIKKISKKLNDCLKKLNISKMASPVIHRAHGISF